MRMLEMSTLVWLNSSSAGEEDTFAAAYTGNRVTYWLWQILPPILLVMGTFGNSMTIVVMRALRNSESTACLSLYFTALAVSDLFVLTSSTLWYWPEISLNAPLSYFHDVSCKMFYFICYASTMTSGWLLVAMTIQRVLSVILPHRVSLLCSVRRGKVVIAGIVALACASFGHFFYTSHLQYSADGFVVCLKSSEDIAYVLTYQNILQSSILPFLFLIVGNSILISKVIQSIRMSRRMTVKQDQAASRSAMVPSMTTTLILTSFVYLITTFPSCVFEMHATDFYAGEIQDEALNELMAMIDTVTVLMWITNSGINFYIYVLSGSKFRKETKRILCSLCRRNKALSG